MATISKLHSVNGQAAGMVDLDAGTVSREIFVSPDIYDQEQEQVFARAWLFVGHESQIPKPGDFFVDRKSTRLNSSHW